MTSAAAAAEDKTRHRTIIFGTVSLALLMSSLDLFGLGSRFVPQGDVSRRRNKIDVVGMLLLAASILSAMFAAAYLGTAGAGLLDPELWVPLGLAALGLVWFMRHSHRSAHPFIAVHLITARGFAIMNAINFLYGSAALGFGALVLAPDQVAAITGLRGMFRQAGAITAANGEGGELRRPRGGRSCGCARRARA